MPERKSIDPQTREALKKEIRDILVARAQDPHPTITYTLLAGQIRTVPLVAQSKALREALIDISTQEDADGRGMLSAVVVRSGHNRLPGKGFFVQAEELGRDVANRRAAWTAELEAVRDYWRGR